MIGLGHKKLLIPTQELLLFTPNTERTMTAKYIPPHLRNKKKETESSITVQMGKLSVGPPVSRTAAGAAEPTATIRIDIMEILMRPCHERCKEFLLANGIGYCEHHEFLTHQRTKQIAEFYQKHSPVIFPKWLEMKRLSFPEGDPNINKCFEKRRFSTGIRFSSLKNAVPELFERFLRYAVDIDVGTGFLDHAISTSKTNGSFNFCDIGFAPGGMSSLLLDAIPSAKGVGINLDPSIGGNVYPERFNTHDRFQVITRDIIDLARDAAFEFANNFDLVIVGITTSGSSQKKAGDIDELELKNLLHFSQLLVAFRNMKPGGSLLIRMHLGLRLVDAHLLAFLFENFQDIKAYKPLTEFAMRKTYWVLATGFSSNSTAAQRLFDLIQPGIPAPYASISPSSETLNNPILMQESESELLEKYGKRMAIILEPIWTEQMHILESISTGLRERVCFSCKKSSCTTECSKCVRNVPAKVLSAVMKVNGRIRNL